MDFKSIASAVGLPPHTRAGRDSNPALNLIIPMKFLVLTSKSIIKIIITGAPQSDLFGT